MAVMTDISRNKLPPTHAGLLLSLLLLLTMLLTLTASGARAAGNGFTSAADNPLAPAAQDDEFLPVDTAYRQDFLFTADGVSALFQIAPNYYLYRDKLAVYQLRNGEKTPLPLTLEQGEVIWDDYFEKETEVYRIQLEFPLQLQEINSTAQTTARVEVHYQGCADAGLCYPPQIRSFELDLTGGQATPVGASGPSTGSSNSNPNLAAANPQATAASDAGMNLVFALALAFAGGMLLNLMPCVFPVLSIKALAISQTASSPAQRQLHGWAYSTGVIITFVLVAGLMLALRAGGEAVGWGFQLQSPALVATLVYLFFAMGLSLSGLTEFGGRLMGIGSGVGQGGGLGGSFASGTLATIVASPCTAPLMGSALGYAITQSAPVALSVFAALGAGMAAPFLLLTYIPQLTDMLPRPGPWMERLKQLLAFPMYLTAVWLLWVLGRQTGSDGVALVLAGAVAIAFALWLWPRPHETQGKWRWGKGIVAAAAMASAVILLPQLPAAGSAPQQVKSSDYWQPYSPELLASARKSGQPVLTNMTAAWCITCLANEKMVLSSDTVSSAISELGIVALKGDWTNQDPQISELLNQYGRTSVPLYLLFPADGGAARILPQILTRDSLLDDLRAAAQSAAPIAKIPAN